MPLGDHRLTTPSRAVAHALDAVTEQRVVTLVQDLVRIPSVTGSAAESEAQHLMAARMDAVGLDTDLWCLDLAALTSDPAFPGMEAPRDEGWGLVGSCGTGDGPTLVLNGHIDVVPTGDLSAWSGDPYSAAVAGDRVLGRGTCDMKGGLACQLLAVEVLREAGVDLHGRLLLQSVVGEEDGGLGTFATLARGYRGDLAVVCEPTSLAVVPACAGALTFRLRVAGLAAHASVRNLGVDAVDKYVLVHAALRRLEASRNTVAHPLMTRYAIPYPLSVGTIRAGDWPSSVPDLLIAEGRIGVALGEDPADVRRALEDCLAEVSAGDAWLSQHPVTVDWYGGQFASGQLPGDSPLQQLVSTAHATVVGTDPQVYGVPYGSDLRLLTGGGVPTVQYGPGDVNAAHAPDEFVPISELVTVTQTLVLLASTVLGGTLG